VRAVLAPDQLAALIAASKDTIWEIPVLLATVTGARRSEVLGISWDDVDFTAGTVSVRRGLQRVSRAQHGVSATFTPLKTKQSHRMVALPPFALDRLRRHRREQLERRSELASAWRDPVDSLRRTDSGRVHAQRWLPLVPDAFTEAFKRLARQAGLHPATRLHDVRQAVPTELGRRGVHSVIVSAVLGHASPAFTASVYQHAWQEGPHEAAAAMAAALAGVGNPLAQSRFEATRHKVAVANWQVTSVGPAGLEPATNGL